MGPPNIYHVKDYPVETKLPELSCLNYFFTDNTDNAVYLLILQETKITMRCQK